MFGWRCQEEPMRHRFRLRNWSKNNSSNQYLKDCWDTNLGCTRDPLSYKTSEKTLATKKRRPTGNHPASWNKGGFWFSQNGRWNQQIPFDCSLAASADMFASPGHIPAVHATTRSRIGIPASAKAKVALKSRFLTTIESHVGKTHQNRHLCNFHNQTFKQLCGDTVDKQNLVTHWHATVCQVIQQTPSIQAALMAAATGLPSALPKAVKDWISCIVHTIQPYPNFKTLGTFSNSLHLDGLSKETWCYTQLSLHIWSNHPQPAESEQKAESANGDT